jgi:hypothetical protein
VSEQTPTVAKTQQDERVPCEVYSRIVGYVRPVRNWNKGKKQEFSERQTYDLDVEPECAPPDDASEAAPAN